MSRRRRPPEQHNHERWLLSYADFITLLFSFFVVMFASSQADKGRAMQVSESVKKALESGSVSAVVASVLGGAPGEKDKGNAQMRGPGGRKQITADEKRAEALADLLPSLNVLTGELKTEIDAGRVQVSMEARGLVVSFKQAALFPSGEDAISASALTSLEKVAAAINKIPNPVRLEGHTDAKPINTPRFRSNWELSTARSIALLEILNTKFQVPRGRISVAGYADIAPIASNETEEGRARNRRVDVVILNGRGALGEPVKPGSPGEPVIGAP